MPPSSSPTSMCSFPSLLTALLLSPCPNASTWTTADRGTEGTHGLGWVRGTENHGGTLATAPQLEGKGGRDSRKSVHAHRWSLCALLYPHLTWLWCTPQSWAPTGVWLEHGLEGRVAGCQRGGLNLRVAPRCVGCPGSPPSSPHHHDRSWRRLLCWNPSATPKP